VNILRNKKGNIMKYIFFGERDCALCLKNSINMSADLLYQIGFWVVGVLPMLGLT